MEWVETIFAAYVVGFAFMMNTNDPTSSVLFRFIPGIGGVLILIDGLSRLGVI
ncbi:hypothetical protein [Tranquillimonas rosea]|uniref:hypothetical protein n=1 Tax=Tranquillimonas rosea TaxID=641238 RepID=UPI003BAAC9C7